MKREDITPFSNRNVEVIIMPNAEKIAGVIQCKADHVEINGSLLAYQIIWGVIPVDVEAAPAAVCGQKGQADDYVKQTITEFLQNFSKEIKALGNTDLAKKLTYIQHKALLELGTGRFPQAVSTCNTGLAEAEAPGSKLPKGFERCTVSMKRIKALSLHAMGSKKAKALAQELMAVPEMKTDAGLLAILEEDSPANSDEDNKPPGLPVWNGISQVYSTVRNLIREKLPPILGIAPDELDDVLLNEKLIPNPSLHSSFIEASTKNHSVSPDLLDVVSLETLGGIMARWWESVFAPHFGGKAYYGYWNVKFAKLKAVRDTIAHAHSEYLSSEDITQSENICREINECLGLPV